MNVLFTSYQGAREPTPSPEAPESTKSEYRAMGFLSKIPPGPGEACQTMPLLENHSDRGNCSLLRIGPAPVLLRERPSWVNSPYEDIYLF